ncbi:ribonuclease H-like domain-containing protein [Vicingaceae bacterium]|nr:ribonuclease H-like domain-containing protein [Vicingaceae bacterium]
MLDQIKLEKVIFIDIETVPLFPHHDFLSEKWKKLWERKAGYLSKENETPEEIYNRAGIYAEFGKIICISIGIIRDIEGKKSLRIKSFSSDDEKSLLVDFSALLRNHFKASDYLLCAHNGKEFDFPYIARRMLVNGLKIPYLLDTAGRKPWEIQHLDTLQLWKFGDYKHYTSLDVLTTLFSIPTPKSDMDGSDVARVYWEEKDLEKIVAYCQRDVVAVAQLILKYKGEELLDPKSIIVA